MSESRNNRLGEVMKLCRAEKGWDQRTAAEKLGVTQRAVSRYENGAIPRDPETLHRIEAVFGIHVAVFKGETLDQILNACGCEIERRERSIIVTIGGKTWACTPV